MSGDGRAGLPFSPWWLVAVAALAMGVGGTYQFVWSSIREPLGLRVGATEAALGTVFTTFVIFQTVSQFPAGWIRDRRGPRLPLAVGAVLVTVGFGTIAVAERFVVVLAAFALGGVGVGAIYTVCINTPVKWFDDRRGLATGVIGMAYGGVSFAAIPLVRGRVETAFAPTIAGLGLAIGLITLLAVVVLRDPADGDPEAGTDEGDATAGDDGGEEAGDGDGDATPEREYTWQQVIRTWQFWILYVAFVAVNGVGLMVIGKVVSFAQQLELSAAAATGSASLVALFDAVGVIVGGAAADRFGSERTTATSLVLCGVALAAAVAAGAGGLGTLFVALVALSALFRSPVFATFPVIVGRYYGRARSSENYAVLYTAKLWGGVGGGVVASLAVATLGWSTTFTAGAVLVSVTGAGIFLLRPVAADPDSPGARPAEGD